MLAGLSADYIVQQMMDMKSRARQTASSTYAPGVSMRAIADSVTYDELRVAAQYFASLPARRRSRVVEATVIPRIEPANGINFRAKEGGTEPLGARLVEMADDAERHELHDARAIYLAYVPPGSVATGRKLALNGRRDGLKSCASCHGPQLRGVGPVPGIAGRAPSYLLRQLIAFKTGARSASQGAPMREVAGHLTLNEMIAAAAYAGSVSPSP